MILTGKNGVKCNFPDPPIEPPVEYSIDIWGIEMESQKSFNRRLQHKHHLEEYERVKFVFISLMEKPV